jgi:DNA-binding NtrC family response regulator
MSIEPKKRILVLDDDPFVRRAMVRAASRRNDVTLEVVGTPDEIRDRLASAHEPFDLVVCDYRLTIDGERTTSTRLVRELAARRIPVVVMTGDLESAGEVADLPQVEKPLLLDELIAQIERVRQPRDEPA